MTETFVLAPFFVPHLLLETGPPPGDGWAFATAPYTEGAEGYLRRLEPPLEGEPPHRPVAFQLGVEGLSSINADYGRLQASARILTTFRLELDAAYGYYAERAPLGGTDSAWLGQAHLAYRFAQSEHLQFRAGIGIRHWTNAAGWAVGPDLLYGIDIFWGRPVTTSLEASGGALGPHAWAGQLRATVGWVIGV